MTEGTGTSLADAVREATEVLAEAGVPSPRADAELLAEHLLGVGLGRLRALMPGDTPAPGGYRELIAERARRIPLQHITGVAYFRYLELAVGPGVFIPRPETESVVQLVIDKLQGRAHPKVVDLGTGSGAIAGSLAHEIPGAEVHAVEYSEFAHAWAAKNLLPLGVHLILGDLRDALPEHNATFDVVVSNPPYIPAAAVPNEPEVALHDPPVALYGGGADGMELPTAAAASAARLLVPGGYFVMEHAEVQSAWIATMLESTGFWTGVSTHRDLNGRDRATSAVLADPAASR
ncbi:MULTISPECIES: peptide chain release factor N(5)-glutamine methyltransferase [unclassified Arthrobacter]|uniref:peptide chain release factor N(5)-glutamine methyltransferase n=1 Tax=unclassified Arthrobacter TaxID=235627 RepID=UPI002DF9CFBF|nr:MULTISPECIES: peptide chain release factor N(5)-glutamine methyltransferase [unclassified Arthrobacter]MEC5191634.1 release factor glutamine methyltransferase [Arthrobacter sp. MP_M4]MEC5203325.1 release factor glutamine methyltransferase [Arthrobacter sp. MP_M7]